MTPKEFFDDKNGRIEFHDTITSGSGQERKIWGHVNKSDLTEEDLILLTLAHTAHRGGMVDANDLRFFGTIMAIQNPACIYASSLDEMMEPLDQINGTKTKDKLFATLLRDAPPITEIRNTLYSMVEHLIKSTNMHPELVYVRELCKHLPRHSSNTKISPF